MEIRTSHLRYLLAIYELSREKMDIGIADIAKAMDCSKASVTNMMSHLMEMGLLVRERYGKIYLTDTGFLLAKDLFRAVTELESRIPDMKLDLTEEEGWELVHELVALLPERCLRKLAGRVQNA